MDATSIYLIILTLVTITSFIGLVFRKSWGRKIGISAMVMTLLFFLYSIISLLLYTEAIPYDEILAQLIWPIFASQAVIVFSIFSIIYINRIYTKELLIR